MKYLYIFEDGTAKQAEHAYESSISSEDLQSIDEGTLSIYALIDGVFRMATVSSNVVEVEGDEEDDDSGLEVEADTETVYELGSWKPVETI
jgi:hypothetical protein